MTGVPRDALRPAGELDRVRQSALACGVEERIHRAERAYRLHESGTVTHRPGPELGGQVVVADPRR